MPVRASAPSQSGLRQGPGPGPAARCPEEPQTARVNETEPISGATLPGSRRRSSPGPAGSRNSSASRKAIQPSPVSSVGRAARA